MSPLVNSAVSLSPPAVWLQVVFDETLQKCLDSYLRHASRGLDPAGLPCSPAVADVQRCVHRAVFMTFLRMATHKESKVRTGLRTRTQTAGWILSCCFCRGAFRGHAHNAGLNGYRRVPTRGTSLSR